MSDKEQRDSRTYAIIGAAMEVHRELGRGFLEAVYQEALAIEFGIRGIPFEREVELRVFYKGKPMQKKYVADFICCDGVVVETKAQSRLTDIDVAQAINYLKAVQQPIGLLLNFGASSLEHKRLIQSAKSA